MLIDDLQIHSRFSGASTREGDPEHLDLWARRKGIHLVGTGDFTHPGWRQELQEKLEPAEEGLYTLRPSLRLEPWEGGTPPRFVVTGEISSIYKKDGKTRKVHSLILLPGLEAAEALSRRLEAVGNLRSDGRPILGLDCRDLLELTLETCPEALFVPAHIWTPHFSLFGAFSGFDSIEECFGDLTPQIRALETGLSSDPPMNWRISALDGLTLLSNSDAHSPAKLGREANLLEIPYSYPALVQAVCRGREAGWRGTVEFFPEEGKYHWDGCRDCGPGLSPEQAEALGGICPVCGKKLTVGVEHRTLQLADRMAGFQPPDAAPFERLAPLPEVISASAGLGPASARADRVYRLLLRQLGPEFYILRQAPLSDVGQVAGQWVEEGLRRLRAGQARWTPGYDGVYGKLELLTPEERQAYGGQVSWFGGVSAPAARKAPALPKTPVSSPKKESAPRQAPAGLNSAQQAAVCSQSPALAVVAGPGTGKTHTLTARILRLLETGSKPGQITAVTFTTHAADQLRQRLEQAAGKSAARAMRVGTFHSLCLELAPPERPALLDEYQALELAARTLKELGLSLPPRRLLDQVSRRKNQAPALDSALNPACEAYQAALERAGAMDFDDILLRGLEQARQMDSKQARRFTHLLVDEFQDSSPLQYQLTLAWAKKSQSLFVIGDPDQAIYGFRGGDAGCFQKLAQDLPALETLRLEENYRSAPSIIRCALALIDHNPGQPRLLRPQSAQGPAVQLVQAESPLAQGIFAAKEAARLAGGVDMLTAARWGREDRAYSFSEMAILCRARRETRLLEHCLKKEGVPYMVASRDDCLTGERPRGAAGFFRFLLNNQDIPGLYAGLTQLFRCPADLAQSLTALARQPDFWPKARHDYGGLAELSLFFRLAEEMEQGASREKPEKLLDRLAAALGLEQDEDWKRFSQTALFHKTMPALLNQLALGQEGDLLRAARRRYPAGALRLTTLHGAKGLEFPVTFVCGLTRGILPLETAQGPTDEEEERRLLYVGMTRARERLILLTSGQPSPFLAEIPASLLELRQAGARAQGRQLSFF